MNGNREAMHDSSRPRHGRWVAAFVVCLAAVALIAPPLAGAARGEEGEGERRPAVREEGREQPREGQRAREGERERRGEGEGERRREGDRRRGLPRHIAQMAAELQVTDAQKKAMQDKADAKDATVRAWRGKNRDKIEAAQAALRKAQEALNALRREERKIAEAAEKEILSVFTPQQLAAWETRKILKMYHRPDAENPLVLTADQLRRVKAMCEDAAKDLVAAAAKPAAEAAAAKRGILATLQKTIYGDILDDAQRRRAPRPRGYGRREGEGERREGERRREREREREPRREGEREREGR